MMPSVWRAVEKASLQQEVARLRKIVDANGRDFQHERAKRRAVEAEVDRLEKESEERRRDLLLQTEATNHFKAEAYSALAEVKRLKAEIERLLEDRDHLHDEVKKLKAELDDKYPQDHNDMHHRIIDEKNQEIERLRYELTVARNSGKVVADSNERLRAANRTNIDIHTEVDRLREERDNNGYNAIAAEREVERLRDKLSFAELYLANYKALYKSACVRARLHGDPTPLPEDL